MKTGPSHLFAELRNQTIRPYSDLLLHDMGAGLADNYAEGQARGSMWRTAPLWGIGYTEKVMGNGGQAGYLHDGRARNLTEAILWHDGEARAARQRFASLARAQRVAPQIRVDVEDVVHGTSAGLREVPACISARDTVDLAGSWA